MNQKNRKRNSKRNIIAPRNERQPQQPEAAIILKVSDTFTANGWDIHRGQDNSCFERYCKMLLTLNNKEEQDLILDLTNRFLWINIDKYLFHMEIALKKLIECERDVQYIYIVPLIANKDRGKIKSSAVVAYLLTGTTFKVNPESNRINNKIVNNAKFDIPGKIDNTSLILFVDDFIGTGETANTAISEFFTIRNDLEKSRIAILSVACQESGIEAVYLKHKINLHSSIIINRGISDFYSNSKLKFSTELMESIEKKLNVDEKWQFGYKKSEALISLIRTPNNTFPIFWFEGKSKRKFTAPFPRM